MTTQLPTEAAADPLPTGQAARTTLPSLAKASIARSVWELKSFFRNVQSMVFTLSLPVILLIVFGLIFDGDLPGTDVSFKQYFVASIIAAGVMSTAFSGLAISVALERDMGLIRRLASSPMPKTAYFIGKIVLVAVTSLLEAVILVAIGMALFELKLPTEPDHIAAFFWVMALGAGACSLAGLAYSALIPNASSASAIVTPPFLVLQFISGVFFPFSQLPAWMQGVASMFPLKWMTQGFRYVFLPESFGQVEVGGSWDLGGVVLVLTAWIVVGTLLTVVTFKWRGPRVK